MPTSVETPDRAARNSDRPDHGGGVFSVLGVDFTALLAALLLILIAVSVFPSQQTVANLAAYLPLQSVLQMLAIVVSILVFAVGWVAYSRERVGNGVLLSCAFLAVGLIDFAFTMSYPGMPDFVTPSSEGKAIDFWLAARALAACALLFAAVRPWRPFAAPRTRYWLLVAALGITALVYWLVLYFEGALPATFIPGQGPTPFKTGAEYTLIAVDVLAAGVFFARLRIERADYLRRLFTACCVIMLSEIFFIFYGDVADINNLPGHLYNAIAYLLIYQALSVRGAEEPYQRLQRSRQPRRANMERRRTGIVSDWRRVGLSPDWYREQDGAAAQAMLAAIVENSSHAIIGRALDGTILSWNAAAERMFGWSASEAIGQPLTIIVPPQLHGLLQPLFERAARGEPVGQVESRHLRRDGTCIDTAGTLVVIRDANGEPVFFTLTLWDITQQKQLEHEVRQKAALTELLEALARAANETATSKSALQDCFEYICDYGLWMLGRIGTFAPGQPKGVPQSSLWHCPQPARFDEFIRNSNSVDHSLRSGKFTAIALREKKAVWASDFLAVSESGRLASAVKSGIRCGFVFPVVVDGEALAFLEFFAGEARDPDAAFLEAINSVAGQLARVIERERARSALHESEHQMRLVTEHLPAMIAHFDAEFICRFANSAYCKFHHVDPGGVTGMSLRDIAGEDTYRAIGPMLERVKQGELVTLRRPEPAESGEIRHIEIHHLPDMSSEGAFLGYYAMMLDITEQVRAETARAQLAAIVEHSNDAIIGRAIDGTVTSWNAAAEHLLGYTAAEVIGRDLVETFPPEARQQIAAIRDLVRTGQSVPSHEVVRITKDGRRIDVTLSVSPIRDNSGNIIGTATILNDITERKRAEQILRNYMARLQTVSRKLLEVQEDERKRLARELHDQVGQVLTALKINLQIIGRQADAAPLALKIENCAQIADAALQQVRTLMLDLRPPQLDELGLAVALRAHAERMVTPANLALHFSAPGVPPKMPPAIEIVCFRITQEALTNILRHAGARNVWIELAVAGEGLELTVRDDGKGFDLAEAHQRAMGGGSIGLLSMEERAMLADGHIEISTAPGMGTTVRAMFSLQAAQSTVDTA